MPDTTHPPSGHYPKPAAVHKLDLEAAADRLAATLPGHGRRSENLAREAGISLVMMVMEAGDTIDEHSADGVVIVHTLRGQLALTVAGEKSELRPGQLALLQPGVPHGLSARKQSVVILTIAGGEA